MRYEITHRKEGGHRFSREPHRLAKPHSRNAEPKIKIFCGFFAYSYDLSDFATGFVVVAVTIVVHYKQAIYHQTADQRQNNTHNKTTNHKPKTTPIPRELPYHSADSTWHPPERDRKTPVRAGRPTRGGPCRWYKGNRTPHSIPRRAPSSIRRTTPTASR